MEIREGREAIGTMLSLTLNRLKAYVNKAFADRGHDLTIDQWIILLLADLSDTGDQSEIAARSGKDKSTAARLIAALEKKGLVERIEDKSDRRKKIIKLTQKGKKAEAELRRISIEANASAIRGVSREDYETTLRTLKKIQENLEPNNKKTNGATL